LNHKRLHILTDTLGLLLAVNVHPASVQIVMARRRAHHWRRRLPGSKMEAVVARTKIPPALAAARGAAFFGPDASLEPFPISKHHILRR
jgi:hypothetical protein